MKTKKLFQAFVFLVMLLSMVGSAQLAYAQDIVDHQMTIWNATYTGYVDSARYEKWLFVLDATLEFNITVTPTVGDLVPLLILMDGSDTEITSATGTLTSTQPAGNYSVKVQPEAGSGFYNLTVRQTSSQESVSTEVDPTSVTVGEAAVVTVSLNNVPAGGYASAEFTCTYDPTLIQVSNIVITSLFGTDPATATNDPQNGTFIVAIAGSNNQRATASGAAFTFDVTSLLAGQATITCTARVSPSPGGDGLFDLPATGATLTINDVAPTLTLIKNVVNDNGGNALPNDFNLTIGGNPALSGVTYTMMANTAYALDETQLPGYTFVEITGDAKCPAVLGGEVTLDEGENVTCTITNDDVVLDGTLTGQVIASKAVTVNLYNTDSSLATSVAANPDGTFSLTAPAGSYTVEATASGFLSAQGPATINAGETTTMATISLLAGDIDGSGVVDQYDALTIGMSYNTATPDAADLNADGIINVLDLELLANNYHATGPTAW